MCHAHAEKQTQSLALDCFTISSICVPKVEIATVSSSFYYTFAALSGD